MHFQATTPGWHEALLAMPDGAVCKGFDAGLLRDAKETWAAAGRDPARLITVLRHFDVYTAPEGTWADAVAHWRAMYARWADGTFYEKYAPFVDIVSESNEYSSTTTWASPYESGKAFRNMQAAAYVWNTDYRGKRGIGDHVRVALMAGPVSNAWPKYVTQLAVDTDSYLDYHAYELCVDGARVWDSWANHSGLWARLEAEHGLKPRWLFGESGPYRDAVQGWRHPACLGGDMDKLVAVMTAWWRDVAQTPAYREGRIAGPGAWFTSGNVGWPYYQLDAGQLLRLAQACRAVWQPGTGDEMRTLTDAEQARANVLLTEIDGRTQELREIINGAPQPLYRVRVIATALNVRGGPGVGYPVIATSPKDTVLSVWEVDSATGWLRVSETVQHWVSGGAAYTERV